MKFVTLIVGCLFTASFFLACQSSTEAPENADVPKADEAAHDNNWQAEMYEPSELVKVMRQMYDDNLALKEKLEAGELSGEMPEAYKAILTAQATNPADLKPSFYAMANVYLEQYNTMSQADHKHVIETYNNLIATCVACHQNYCLGPIPKIEKLYIKQ